MIQHPGILALFLASGLVCLLLGAAGWQAIGLLRAWDPGSGSEAQLAWERRTYLVSAFVSVALGIQLLSLFLFIFTADGLHSQFVGAMCAAGSLSVNAWGYPTLLVKVASCLGAGAWLALQHTDTQGFDYPLIRPKYAWLLALLPLVFLDAFLQFRYLAGLRADVMTSCCGSLFGLGRQGLASELASLSPRVALPAFWLSYALLLATGVLVLKARRGAVAFAVLALTYLVVALEALISVFCLYIYELPTHHCPFCLLQRPYHFVGYLLYACLLGTAMLGLGAGLLAPFRRRPSLAQAHPRIQRRLVLASLALASLFALVVALWSWLSPLKL